MRASLSSTLALLLLTSAAGATEPALEVDGEHNLLLHGLPPILEEEEVHRQLTTGLTTSFAFRTDLLQTRNGKSIGGARVDIRYELWDEDFHVLAVGIDGRPRRHVVASLDELLVWWRELHLPILDLDSLAAEPAIDAAVRITLDVVPFSHSEQVDTQRWFSESVTRAGQNRTDGTSSSPDDGEDSLGRVFGVLMATSIQRRALMSYRWTLELPERTQR